MLKEPTSVGCQNSTSWEGLHLLDMKQTNTQVGQTICGQNKIIFNTYDIKTFGDS